MGARVQRQRGAWRQFGSDSLLCVHSQKELDQARGPSSSMLPGGSSTHMHSVLQHQPRSICSGMNVEEQLASRYAPDAGVQQQSGAERQQEHVDDVHQRQQGAAVCVAARMGSPPAVRLFAKLQPGCSKTMTLLRCYLEHHRVCRRMISGCSVVPNSRPPSTSRCISHSQGGAKEQIDAGSEECASTLSSCRRTAQSVRPKGRRR